MSKPRLCVESLSTHDLGPYSLDVVPGESVSLSGPSGSGKSLLLRAIADLDPHDGKVLLNGTPVNEVPAPQWRKKVCLLPADSQWWFDDVGSHFPAGGYENNNKDRCPYLQPLGFDEKNLSWQVSRLSSGERQRLALARALMNQPEVLLLDEPTASLDPKSISYVEDLVSKYQRETDAAVIWVSHDAEQRSRVCSRHFSLKSDGLEEESL